MSNGRLIWDEVKDRHYTDGLDRGVLYLPDGRGIIWNGLVSLDEETGVGEIVPLYFDGEKYLNFQAQGDFSAVLRAFTYPDEFLDVENLEEIANGLHGDDQDSQQFGLCYRTLHDKGYYIHILYNLIAVPETKAYRTISSTTNPALFSWKLDSVPCEVAGYASSEHFILDSEKLDPFLLSYFEDVLYGSENQDASLPDILSLIGSATDWDPQVITVSSTPGIFNLTSEASGDLIESDVEGFFVLIPGSRLNQTEIAGLYELE